MFRIFHWGPRPKGRKWGGVLEEEQQAPSHQLGNLGSTVSLQRGLGRSPDRPKVFHCYQHSGWPLLTIILFILDHKK